MRSSKHNERMGLKGKASCSSLAWPTTQRPWPRCETFVSQRAEPSINAFLSALCISVIYPADIHPKTSAIKHISAHKKSKKPAKDFEKGPGGIARHTAIQNRFVWDTEINTVRGPRERESENKMSLMRIWDGK